MPIDSFKIALAADAEAIASLVNQAYRPSTVVAGWTHESHLVSGVRIASGQVLDLISASDSRILLAYRQAVLIACVHLKKEGADCHIGMLAVKPDGQCAGIGKRLLAYAENHAASEWAVKAFVMAVLTARTELLDFYLRRGYQKTGKVMAYPVDAGVGTPRQDNLTLDVLVKQQAILPTKEAFPVLKTARLLLRTPHLDDATTLANLLTPAVSEWLAAWPESMGIQGMTHKIANAHVDNMTDQAWHLLLQRQIDDAVIGWASVSRCKNDKRIGDLSYWLGEAYQGAGYVGEALAAMMPVAFAKMDFMAIEAGAQLENHASFAVMRKLGMEVCDERLVWASARNREERCLFYSIARDCLSNLNS